MVCRNTLSPILQMIDSVFAPHANHLRFKLRLPVEERSAILGRQVRACHGHQTMDLSCRSRNSTHKTQTDYSDYSKIQ